MNALLFNTPYDQPSLAEFSSIHQFDHFDITLRLFRTLGLTAELPPLDPIPTTQLDLLTWLMNHQFAHNQENGYLRDLCEAFVFFALTPGV